MNVKPFSCLCVLSVCLPMSQTCLSYTCSARKPHSRHFLPRNARERGEKRGRGRGRERERETERKKERDGKREK